MTPGPAQWPCLYRGEHGGSVNELVSGNALVVAPLDMPGLLTRGRTGPGRARGLARPDGLRSDVTPVEGDESDEGDEADEGAESDEGAEADEGDESDEGAEVDEGDDSDGRDVTDEPAVDVGEQLTPGVWMGDALGVVVEVRLELLLAVVDDELELGCGCVLPLPFPPVVCANAGAALKAIAHARHALLRIGIFRMLVKVFLLLCHPRSTSFSSEVDPLIQRITLIGASYLPIPLVSVRETPRVEQEEQEELEQEGRARVVQLRAPRG